MAEIELKLMLPEDALAAFRRHGRLRGAEREPARILANTYFDTPELDLHGLGIALRLRKSGRQWLQTVKCAGEVVAGLSERPEWEQAFGGRFDFAAVDDPAVARKLEKYRLRLEPVFTTHFRREGWIVPAGTGARVHVTLDRGQIEAAGRSLPLCEAEVELLQGDASAVQEIGLALAADLPLLPDSRSKAERGYDLFRGRSAQPVRAAGSPLQAEHSPLQAFRVAALDCLHQFQGNVVAGQGSDDPEYVHQMRVALRRLRSALRLFKPALPVSFVEEWNAQLRAIMQPLGMARDWDVLATETLPAAAAAGDLAPPTMEALQQRVLARREAVRREAAAALARLALGEKILRLAFALDGLPEPAEPVGLPAFASRQIARQRKRLLRDAAACGTADPSALHALRVDIKRLRYMLEFVAPLRGFRRARRVAAGLARMQGVLGSRNDLYNASRLLQSAAGEAAELQAAAAFAVGFHAGRLPAQSAFDVGELRELLTDLRP